MEHGSREQLHWHRQIIDRQIILFKYSISEIEELYSAATGEKERACSGSMFPLIDAICETSFFAARNVVAHATHVGLHTDGGDLRLAETSSRYTPPRAGHNS